MLFGNSMGSEHLGATNMVELVVCQQSPVMYSLSGGYFCESHLGALYGSGWKHAEAFLGKRNKILGDFSGAGLVPIWSTRGTVRSEQKEGACAV